MPSTQKYPGNNLTALLIGTGEFSFSLDATSKADALAKGYVPFGNIVAWTPSVEPTLVEHFGSYQGKKRKDKTVITQTKLEYQLRCDEWNRQNLEILFGATALAAHTQSSMTDQACDALPFTTSPSSKSKWYDLTVSGARVYHLTEVLVPTKVEGTDFEVDLLNGRIRFLVDQTSNLTPTVDGPAITATDAKSYLGLLPFGDTIKQGYGKLIVYDEHDANKVVMRHLDFSCEIRVESASELSGQDWSDMTMVVSVTDEVGRVEVRQDNDVYGL
jgi:hypothetical protein